MKSISNLTLASLAALAACGEPENASSPVVGPDNVQALPEDVAVNDTAAVGEPDAAESAQRPPDAETSIPPVPPKSPGTGPQPPPPPKEDPHAGHDMGNMANNQ